MNLPARHHLLLRAGIVLAAALGLVLLLQQTARAADPTKAQVRAHLAAVRTQLLATLPLYKQGRYDTVRSRVGTTYLKHFEVLEEPLEHVNKGLSQDIEHSIAVDLRGMAKAHRSYAVYKAKVNQVLGKLPAAQRALGA